MQVESVNKFPLKSFNPERSERERHEYKGVVNLSDLPGVDEIEALNAETQLNVKMLFALEKGGVVIVKMSLSGEVQLMCQRTLEPFSYPINTSVELAAVESERQMELLSSHYEPVIMNDGWLNPVDMIGEELLLSLPVVPKKPLSDCDLDNNQAYFSATKSGHEEEMKDRENPFAVLEALKSKKH